MMKTTQVIATVIARLLVGFDREILDAEMCLTYAFNCLSIYLSAIINHWRFS